MKYYELFIKKDHSIQNIHRFLFLLIFISCLASLIGILGFFMEVQQSINVIAFTGFQDIMTVTTPIFRSIAVICFGFAAAVAGAIMWLIFIMKTLDIEDQEYAFLS